MEQPTECVHHWVLGELTGRSKNKWVHYRAASCKKCGISTEQPEREHPLKLDEEMEELADA